MTNIPPILKYLSPFPLYALSCGEAIDDIRKREREGGLWYSSVNWFSHRLHFYNRSDIK